MNEQNNEMNCVDECSPNCGQTVYEGKKTVKARPMNRADYNKLRDWKIPDNENGEDEGYFVEYMDGGKPNHPDYMGYISWSPKDVFEQAYKPAENWIDRLFIERAELAERMSKLEHSFRCDYQYGPEHRDLLARQLLYMKDYLEVLNCRIALYVDNAFPEYPKASK